MRNYLLSFPSSAMQVAEAERPAVADAARAVVREAKAAGVWVFGGGIDASVAPVRVAADGGIQGESDAEMRQLDGGFAVLRLASRDEALHWAARLAAACRCAQELRVFGDDPESLP